MFKVAPALAAGCTLVVKPAPETAVDAFALADAAEACGFPPGVINVITGGRDVGAYLVDHPGVDKVAFTGSTAAGRAIAETCGRMLRPVTLELGGKSAAIVLDDADVAQTVRGLSSTSCCSTTARHATSAAESWPRATGTTRSSRRSRVSPGRSRWATRSIRAPGWVRW